MATRFLIEVPHSENTLECARAVEIFLSMGSHFMTQAEWGCKDGVHKAWIIVDADDRDAARAFVPAVFRSQASVVQLNTFSRAEIDELLRIHRAPKES